MRGRPLFNAFAQNRPPPVKKPVRAQCGQIILALVNIALTLASPKQQNGGRWSKCKRSSSSSLPRKGGSMVLISSAFLVVVPKFGSFVACVGNVSRKVPKNNRNKLRMRSVGQGLTFISILRCGN